MFLVFEKVFVVVIGYNMMNVHSFRVYVCKLQINLCEIVFLIWLL